MKLVERTAEHQLKRLADQYPVVTLTGPRQSGKTTLCRMAFPEMAYVNLERPDQREYAASDPNAFLSQFPEGAIIDEFQYVPDLTSYIQVLVDEPAFDGTFVLTGSRNFAVRNTVNQSLAGRTGLLDLLPFSLSESSSFFDTTLSVNELLFRGSYPRIYAADLDPAQALADYVATYVERDLRQLSLIRDLTLFQTFLGLCAGRVGQLLNLEGLGDDTGISQGTAREWVSLLEASYIAFRLPPFFQNISKRLIKKPKLYFYDVGLAAHLLGISTPEQMQNHPLRGMLYENLVLLEILKFFRNHSIRQPVLFYRDSNGNEVDAVLPQAQYNVPIEIKSASTISSSLFTGLHRFSKTVQNATHPMLIYAGNEQRLQSGVQVLNHWQLEATLEKIM